ncbi:hypothetical protein [Hymenobacter rubidus]|uniref:hypothetical protein n=1 Tax=Hymenobacter rubidus TaxID=1441626 RepID=UPI001920156B|nr:hypothetical protein [Hymenobacter rubidus]
MKNEPLSEHEWVEQTLRSLEGTARPEPSAWLYAGVRRRLAAGPAPMEAPGVAWVLARVAVLAALVVANMVTFAHHDDFVADNGLAPTPVEYAYPTLSDY